MELTLPKHIYNEKLFQPKLCDNSNEIKKNKQIILQ